LGLYLGDAPARGQMEGLKLGLLICEGEVTAEVLVRFEKVHVRGAEIPVCPYMLYTDISIIKSVNEPETRHKTQAIRDNIQVIQNRPVDALEGVT